MVRNVSSIILYALVAVGITLITVNAMMPPAFGLVALIASLILIAPPLSLGLRFALYAIAALNVFAVTLLPPIIPIAGVAAVAVVGGLFVSELDRRPQQENCANEHGTKGSLISRPCPSHKPSR